MKAKDVLEHFLSRASWVDRTKTVDRIIVGDPEKEVRRCLVTWMPSFAAVRAAADKGVELILCHEPTFWDHWDKTPETQPLCAEKLRFIHEHGLVIIRNHDAWDGWPGIGIPWAWAKFLGLKGKPAAFGPRGRYQHRYDIDAVPFGEFAADVARRTAAIGEPMVQTVGDPEKPVSRIGIGTGCYCSVFTFVEMGCDCCVVCDDGVFFWRDVQYAEDIGVPVIRVNHGTSEEPGMVALTQYVNEHLDGVTAEHLPQGCRFRLKGGSHA
ncbi:MAG TPA: Nif3-like dinuclear metal center hexameric protein [Planctomycetota bacterium]|nr:Nif3-like dinuclear metal center hexameric protein [Planctomycetota bacterium]